jgi:DNA-binding transcriptional MerR regulator
MVSAGTDSWTLEGLVERVTAELAERGLLGAQRDGRVAAAPDARTVRYYQSLGLIDRPRLVGREARYLQRHRLQLLAIKALQSRGVPLAEVQARLYGRSDAELLARVAEVGGPGRMAPAAPAPYPAASPIPAGMPAAGAAPPRVTHQIEVSLLPGVRLLIDAGATPPADPASLQTAIVAALAAWNQMTQNGPRGAGEGGA